MRSWPHEKSCRVGTDYSKGCVSWQEQEGLWERGERRYACKYMMLKLILGKKCNKIKIKNKNAFAYTGVCNYYVYNSRMAPI